MLGITPTSTLQEVRRAYKTMALMCHPDKGGSLGDMRIVQSSYEYICHQLGHVALEAEKGTYEEREAEFKAFLRSQEEQPIHSMHDVYLDTFERPDMDQDVLNKMKNVAAQCFPHDSFLRDMVLRNMLRSYDSTGSASSVVELEQPIEQTVQEIKDKVIPASIQDGYGEALDLSTEHKTYNIGKRDSLTQPLHTVFETRDLVVHNPSHQCALVHMVDVPADIPLPNKLDDYSVRYMCDYRMAYSDTIQSNTTLETVMKEEGSFAKTFELVLEERNKLDEQLKTKVPEKITLSKMN
jgi:hypothetical protein